MAKPPQDSHDQILRVATQGMTVTITFFTLSDKERNEVVGPVLNANAKYIASSEYQTRSSQKEPCVLICIATGIHGNSQRNQYVGVDLGRRLSRLLRPALSQYRAAKQAARTDAPDPTPQPAETYRRHGPRRGRDRTLPA